MSISFDEYRHFGMEKYDGGNEAWDFNNDGKLDLFEENCRRTYDEMMYETQFTYQNEPEFDEDFDRDGFGDEDFDHDNFEDEDFDRDDFEDEDFDCDDFGEDW